LTDIRVVLQSADRLSLAGLASYLRSRDSISVLPVERWDSANVAVVATDRWRGDLAAELHKKAAAGTARVVLVVDELSESDLLSAVESRVVGVVPRAMASEETIHRAVLGAAAGSGMLSPKLVGELIKHIERIQREILAPNGLSRSGLTRREIDVLRLMADGFDTAEIGVELSYSQRTVKNVIYGITHRLKLRSRCHAVAYAIRTGAL
jgi:DNA-binding NarL/FixJ family response regulator